MKERERERERGPCHDVCSSASRANRPVPTRSLSAYRILLCPIMRAESGRIHAGEVKRTARKCGPPRNVTVASCRSSHQSRNRHARAHNRLLYVVPALQARSGQVLAIHPLCLVISTQGKAPNHTRQPPLAIITILISILCS